jgi:ATP synthase subunit 6
MIYISYNFIKNIKLIFDPLAQFEVISSSLFFKPFIFVVHFVFSILPFNEKTLFCFELTFSNLINFLLLFFFIQFFFYSSSQYDFKYTFWNYLDFFKIQIFLFAENIVKANSSLKIQNWFLILFFTFVLIMGVNLIGLIPYVFTITSAFIITFTYSLIIFICINILGIYRTGFFKFFEMFLPSGTPLSITFLLILIELISYIARLFSLSIRLFANMMAGHTLLKILIGFSFAILLNNIIFFSIALIPWIIVTIILILEVLIGLLQSYVYLILACIYINDVVLKH